jgi:type III restriction enzyme
MPETQNRYSLDLKIEQGQEFLSESYQDKYKKFAPLLENNIKQGILPREYQTEALGRLIYYINEYRGKPTGNIHLMFNMATGSGKTLVLAQTILFLYSKGYRNFLFVSRLGNVVKKTIENLINSSSSKFLFANSLNINGKNPEVKSVQNFSGVNDDDINILFSTLTNIHGKLATYKENNLTFEGLSDESKKLIIIADEAHNLNSYTKVKQKGKDLVDDGLENYDFSKLNAGESEEFASWEGTIKKLLHANPANILLEYTATIPNKPEVRAKYDDKVIYQYDITKFRDHGYSKHPYTQTSQSNSMDRALLGTFTSFYRQKLAEKKGLFIKPVLLLKANRASLSDTFDPNKDVYLKDFEISYSQKIASLTTQEFLELKTKYNKEALYSKVFNFLESELDSEQIIEEIKIEFGNGKVLVSSSGDDTEFRNLNTLEEKQNPFRVVIAVNTLDEGWDVLNLFDIVRLYENGAGKGNNTVAEAQLIGRGVRYNPIIDPQSPDKDRFKRKFDTSDYKDLETLYFHSINDSNYISSLEKELKALGLSQSREYKFKIKDDILQSDFWQKMVLYKNEVKQKHRDGKTPLEIYLKNCENRKQSPVVASFNLLSKGESISVLDDNDEINNQTAQNYKPLDIVEKSFWFEALDRAFFDFKKLQSIFPNCTGKSDFIDNYLQKIQIRINSDSSDIPKFSKLNIAITTLQNLIIILNSNTFENIGTTKFIQYKLSDVIKATDSIFKKEEPLKINISESENYIAQDVIYGTSLEIEFVKHIKNLVNESKLNKNEIKLVRNEQYFAIYEFDTARAFYPDFVLYHTKKQQTIQFFIEPKGGHLEGETWKEDFLKEIENKLEINDERFKVVGLSFFKEGQESQFLDELLNKVKDQ